MSNNVGFTYTPQKNGPLGPRAQARLQMRVQLALMVEDRDAVTDLSQEPDLTDFPTRAWQFLGDNLCAEDVEPEELADENDMDVIVCESNDWSLSEEGTATYTDHDPDWVETQYRKQFPHLWEASAEEDEMLDHNYVPEQSGTSGFGSGEKYKVGLYDFDEYPPYRSQDDGRKQRKAAINRFRRSERKLRTVETARCHESKADLAFDHFPALDQAYYRGEFLRSPSEPSSQGWWFMDLPPRERFLFEEREREEAEEQRRQDDRLDAAHFRSIVYGHPYDDYGMEVYPDDHFDYYHDDDDFDMYIPTTEEIEAMIAWQEAEEERLLETLPIDHSGGHRGVKARLAANRNQTRPHHFLEVA